ncbi:pectinesterase family protein [Paenibacillus cremeus]
MLAKAGIVRDQSLVDLSGHWAKEDVEWMVGQKVVSGTSDTTFSPQNQITRAQFATLLVRVLGLTPNTEMKYSDVTSGDWYAGAVGAAVKAGLIEGFTNGSFLPNAPITREQMATAIGRALKQQSKPSAVDVKTLSAFTDSSQISSTAKEAVALVVKAGIMNGLTDTTFGPTKEATRAQAAVIMKRYLQLDGSKLTSESSTVQAAVYSNAIVDGTYTGTDGSAAASGAKQYKTVQSALDGAPADSTKPYVIFIKNGRYYEKVTVEKPNITLIGESREKTKITFDLAADSKKPDGKTYGTFDSATLSVFARNFTADNMTIENGFDYNANAAKDAKDPTKMANAQAVALRTDKDSDHAVFNNLNLLGFQDTLYAQAGTQYYQNCYIAGNVDFIFGAGQAVFDDCDIVSLDRGSKSNNGYVTAASTLLSNTYGFLFIDSRIKKESPGMADNTVALGRPWHPTTNLPDGTRAANPDAVASVAYVNCYLDSHIRTGGWDPMSGKDKDGNVIWFYPKDSRFYESGNTGPGAASNEERQAISDANAKDYTIAQVLGGWDPKK